MVVPGAAQLCLTLAVADCHAVSSCADVGQAGVQVWSALIGQSSLLYVIKTAVPWRISRMSVNRPCTAAESVSSVGTSVVAPRAQSGTQVSTSEVAVTVARVVV